MTYTVTTTIKLAMPDQVEYCHTTRRGHYCAEHPVMERCVGCPHNKASFAAQETARIYKAIRAINRRGYGAWYSGVESE